MPCFGTSKFWNFTFQRQFSTVLQTELVAASTSPCDKLNELVAIPADQVDLVANDIGSMYASEGFLQLARFPSLSVVPMVLVLITLPVIVSSLLLLWPLGVDAADRKGDMHVSPVAYLVFESLYLLIQLLADLAEMYPAFPVGFFPSAGVGYFLQFALIFLFAFNASALSNKIIKSAFGTLCFIITWPSCVIAAVHTCRRSQRAQHRLDESHGLETEGERRESSSNPNIRREATDSSSNTFLDRSDRNLVDGTVQRQEAALHVPSSSPAANGRTTSPFIQSVFGLLSWGSLLGIYYAGDAMLGYWKPSNYHDKGAPVVEYLLFLTRVRRWLSHRQRFLARVVDNASNGEKYIQRNTASYGWSSAAAGRHRWTSHFLNTWALVLGAARGDCVASHLSMWSCFRCE